MYITVEKADMVCKFRICMAADQKVASSTNRSPSPAQTELAQWRSNVYTGSFRGKCHTVWIVPQTFKLLPKRHIFFDLVIRFIINRKYAFLYFFSRSDCQLTI